MLPTQLALLSLMLSKLLQENGLDFSYLLMGLLGPPTTGSRPLLDPSELSRPGTPGTPGPPGTPGTPGTPGMSGGTPPPLPSGPVDLARRPPPRSRERLSSNVSRRQ